MDRPKRRSLLVASVGIATVSYVLAACGKDQHPVSGNLPAPEPSQTTSPVTGNLPAPPPMDAAPPPSATTTATPSASASAKPTPAKK